MASMQLKEIYNYQLIVNFWQTDTLSPYFGDPAPNSVQH